MGQFEASAVGSLIYLLALITSGYDCIKLDDEYINWPQPENDDVRDWLQELNQIGLIKPGSEPETVLAQLNQAKFRFINWDDLTKFYMLLGIVKDSSGTNCPSEVSNLLLSVYIQIQGLELDSLERFLDHYGSKKFDSCAWQSISEIRQMKHSKVEKEFDEFYRRALKLDRDDGDALLFAYLKGFDVTSENMGVTKMADKSLYSIFSMKNEGAARILWFFVKKCERFRAEFGKQLDLMNMARALTPGREYFGHIRFLKLNEYNRICLNQIRRRSELEYNIRAQFQ